MIGECIHGCCIILGMYSAPPILAVMYLVSLWYMVPSFLGSFRASLNCSPIHLR